MGLIRTVPETGSTNADLAARLTGGEQALEGEWLVADRQSAGRGRLGREWFDGAGNFMGSTVIRRADGDPPLPGLPFVAGLAVYEAVASLPGDPSAFYLKWPNDLMVGDAKLAGILLESVAGAVIVGVGVNLARAPQVDGRRTIALADRGPAPDRDTFAAALAASFAAELGRWRRYGMAPLLSRWLAVAHPSGTPLVVRQAGAEPLSGAFDGLESDGALRLRLASGETRVIHAGDVFV